ncbi:hypothetical protein PIB30_034058 [Stylosanthes scabra]|uniref:Leucine-rich repeat-containing N-terminal plant-type domain-containing protein n=1 Tax=Stylosanthes scabra TaxID=79078 RepID=A0ABU6Y9Z1_9FABA|nr:hypothetical protein [Stylosanthes scabra]
MGIRYFKIVACAVVILVLVLVEIAELCICANSTTLMHSPPCLETERQTLVKFKASLKNSSNLLSSWHGDDCCRWKGIGCDNVTGHVVMLDLATPFEKCWRSFSKIVGLDLYLLEEYDSMSHEYDCDHLYNQYLEDPPWRVSRVSEKFESIIDPRSRRESTFCTIPSWSANTFSSLQILRLRQNILSGRIPPQICELSSLKILDLSRNNLNGSIPWCIGNLQGMTLEAPTFSPTSPDGSISASISISLPPEYTNDWKTEDVMEVVKGSERDYIRILKLVVMMDLAENNLVGSNPKG